MLLRWDDLTHAPAAAAAARRVAAATAVAAQCVFLTILYATCHCVNDIK